MLNNWISIFNLNPKIWSANNMAFLGNDTMRTSFTQQCVPPATVNEKKVQFTNRPPCKTVFSAFPTAKPHGVFLFSSSDLCRAQNNINKNHTYPINSSKNEVKPVVGLLKTYVLRDKFFFFYADIKVPTSWAENHVSLNTR